MVEVVPMDGSLIPVDGVPISDKPAVPHEEVLQDKPTQ